ncbi:origin recognition complex subunit [Raphidocelis subcapitata]|uniref:Origin recognition complex subunit 1 n=1 Tax=Raphidocelis subcapitata TaxID=307507 RepID=A0A2V0PE46_9CHLO|nr:origin recognition complex subunit [Raphidocelis subcapitata]|eukprot:GBF97789.1 origin recognition complex subunit [Raphidocelis subcapitata]
MGRTRGSGDTAARDQEAAGGESGAASRRSSRAAAADAKARLAGTLPPRPALPPPLQAAAAPPAQGKKGDAAAGSSKGRDQAARKAPAPSAAARGKRGRVTRTLRTEDGETLSAGDDMYIALDSFDWEAHVDEGDEACEVCGRSELLNGMLECGCCLRGFHMRCLRPALKKVPEGEWLCPQCDAGEAAPRPKQLVTYWQRLLYGENVVGLVHVLGFADRPLGGQLTPHAIVRYYLRPEDTHLGRQRHHGARELFLGRGTHYEPAAALLKRAFVRSPRAFAAAQDGACEADGEGEDEGNDAFVCEYEYDEGWKRFKRRLYPGESRDPDARDGACDWGLGGGGSSDDEDEGGSGDGEDAYKPERAARGRRAGGRGWGRKHGVSELLAGLEQFDGLGVEAVPAAPAAAARRDPLSEVHAALSLASVPAVLPCRDAEKRQLAAFVEKAIRGDGGVLYVCGVPGTGKTACMVEVLASARARAKAAGTQFVSLNCLQLPTPQHVYSKLWERLSGQHLGPARARDALQTAFCGSGRRRFSTLIVLDEIDMLMTRDQAVLYNLFEWPLQPGARLSVVGISNTHDLDQRVLPRIGSRLTEAKLAFQPYSVAQISSILKGRLAACSEAARARLDGTALELAARKVASETGDVRRALELLRRAAEIAQFESQQQQQQQPAAGGAGGRGGGGGERDGGGGGDVVVRPAHVSRAQQELFNAMHMQMLRGTSLLARLLLVGVVLEGRATGRGQVLLQSVMARVQTDLCPLIDEPPPTDGALQHAAARLAATRLALADAGHVKARLQLNVSRDDIAAVVRDDARLARLHQLMG